MHLIKICKEARRVKPWLSELDVPEWQELAGDRLGWRKMLKSIKIRTSNIACVAGTGQKMDRAHVIALYFMVALYACYPLGCCHSPWICASSQLFSALCGRHSHLSSKWVNGNYPSPSAAGALKDSVVSTLARSSSLCSCHLHVGSLRLTPSW
jgi:hypothetical protein